MRHLPTVFAFLLASAQVHAEPPVRDPQDRPINKPSGTLITIKRENIVHNRTGNCAWCAVETLARHQGITQLAGMANGKGGANPSDIDAFLTSRGIEHTQATDKQRGLELIYELLESNRPFLFGINRHALVGCGMTRDAKGQVFVWVIDNTGNEEAQIKGWTWAELDSRWSGWVCGLGNCRPRPSPCPGPNCPQPRPHIDPSPETVPTITPAPTPKVEPDVMQLIAELRAEIKSITLKPGPVCKDGLPGMDGAPGKDGQPGPQGSAGRDGRDFDPAAIAILQRRLDTLEKALSAGGVIKIHVEPKISK